MVLREGLSEARCDAPVELHGLPLRSSEQPLGRAMGATFPVAARWLAARSGAAIEAGVLYAGNSAGAAAGAICAGFWLIPTLGLRRTTWIGVGLNIAAAAGALWVARRDTDVVDRPSSIVDWQPPQPL